MAVIPAVSARIDLDRFADLYQRHRDAVYRYLRRWGADDDEAADLTARTFERALSHLHSCRGGADGFAAWVFRIARNQAIDARRRRHPATALDFVAPQLLPRSANEPEADALRREEFGELHERLMRLSAVERECLALRYAGHLTARQIGMVIGKSEAATQKVIGRALAALRESYQ